MSTITWSIYERFSAPVSSSGVMGSPPSLWPALIVTGRARAQTVHGHAGAAQAARAWLAAALLAGQVIGEAPLGRLEPGPELVFELQLPLAGERRLRAPVPQRLRIPLVTAAAARLWAASDS